MIWIKQFPPFVRVIALLLLSLVITFLITSSVLFKDIDTIFYDFWFTFRDLGKKVHLLDTHVSIAATDKYLNDDIVIIGIDEESINTFNAYPWSRMKYITFFEYMNSAPPEKRPAAVFLDILFVDKSYKKIEEEFYLKNPEEQDKEILDSREYAVFRETVQKYQVDTPLGEAIGECGRVFLPFNLVEKKDLAGEDYTEELQLLKSFSITAKKNESLPLYKRVMPPVMTISARAEGIGSVIIEESGVESLRKIPLLARFQIPGEPDSPGGHLSRYYPSVDLLMALRYYHVPLEHIVVKWGNAVILKNALDPETGRRGDIPIPIDNQGNLRINYRAPHNSFTVRSFANVREGRIPLDYFKGKYVLVGVMSPGASHDFWISPVGGMYGIEHHANVLNTLLNRDFLYTFPGSVIFILMVLFIVITGFATYRQKFLLSSLIMISILTGLFIISIVTFYYNIVFPYTYFFLSILVTFIIILIYKGFSGELAILGLSRDIQKQILYNKELKEDLTGLVESTINAAIEQVSDIDGYTGLHNEVLGILGNEFYQSRYHIYFNEAEAEILRLARLHDIGKININPNILRKSGRLSGPEYEEIKWHTIAGGRYLERFKGTAFKDAARIAFGHQESWDGMNGYPRGIPNAVQDTEIREGKQIRWNLILDFMAVMDTFHAMASNRPYRKGLNIEIVFRELVYNANTQFGTCALEEFFSFFYRLYKEGIIKITGNAESDISHEKNTIFVTSSDPENAEEMILRHKKIMEFFNKNEKDRSDNEKTCCFEPLRLKLLEYILIDSKNPSIKQMKNTLYSILMEKHKIKQIMTTYLNPEKRMKLAEKINHLNEKQEKIKENLYIKKKYKQLFIKKIMIEYYNILKTCKPENLHRLCEGSWESMTRQKLKFWYTTSVNTLELLNHLIEDTRDLHRYNNVCRFLHTIGISSHTSCYIGNIFLILYHHFTEEERSVYFEKIENLRLAITGMKLPDSPRLIHILISFLETALLKKTNEHSDDLLKQWNTLYAIMKTYCDNALLTLPGELKETLIRRGKTVPGYNVFILLIELLGAYYMENQTLMEENWRVLFHIMDHLNLLKTEVYSTTREAITHHDSDFLSHITGKSVMYFNINFPSNAGEFDFLTYLLQVEKEYLLQKINTPFLKRIIDFLDLHIWKKANEIEEAYTVLKNIERKDYVEDFQGSTIRMIKKEDNESYKTTDIFRHAMEWVEETLKTV